VFARFAHASGSALLLSIALVHVPSTAAQGTGDAALQTLAIPDSKSLEKEVAQYQAILSASPGSIPKTALDQTRIRLATAYFMLHRYEDSLHALPPLENIRLDDLSAQAWTVKGLDEIEVSRLPAAVASLRRAVALNPKSATARLALGDALARSQRMEDAASAYQQQTKLTPSLADAWYKLGLAHSQISVEISQAKARSRDANLMDQLNAEELLAKGDNLNAARLLFRILRNAPNQPEVHADLGNALLRLGYVKAAQDHFSRELANNPASPSASLGVAQTAAMSARWQDVSVRFEELSRSQPQELRRLLEFPPAGVVLDAVGKGELKPPETFLQSPTGNLWKSWLSDREVVARLSPESISVSRCPGGGSKQMQPGFWMAEQCYLQLATRLESKPKLSSIERTKLIESEFRLGHYTLALNRAAHLHAADPSSGWGIYWLSKTHDAIAEECFLKVGALNPDSARVHQMLADHYAKLADYPKAKAEFQSAIHLAPQAPELHLGLGRVLSRAGELPEAEKELQTTLAVSPKSAFAHYELGHIYVLESRWPDAIAELQQVPDDTTVVLSARLDLAKAKSEAGQVSQAIKDLLSVSRLDQDGEVYFRLAALYRRIGDEANAREALAIFKQRRATSQQSDSEELSALEKEQESDKVSPPPSAR
jgi:tetratricopeptide (TPR) repeat protein